jgi:hypothetical protein
MQGYCSTFQRLFIAGITILMVQIMYFFLCTIWTLVIFLEIFGKHPQQKVVPVIIVTTPVTQLVGLLAWVGISGARFGENCYADATSIENSQPLCATDAPALLITSIVLTSISAAVYFAIRSLLGQVELNKVQPEPED